MVKLLGMKDAKGYASSASDLFCEGQAGMAGVAIDPNFASNRFIYVYSTSSLTAPGTHRVMRLKANDNAFAVSDRTAIVADIPYMPRASGLRRSDLHPQRITFRPGTKERGAFMPVTDTKTYPSAGVRFRCRHRAR